MIKKVGIIGSTGFLGKSLVEYLNPRKFQIFSLSRVQKIQISEKVNNIYFDLNNQNISNVNHLDCLILAASETSPQSNPDDYALELKKNILPHINLLKNLHNSNVKHIIYFSSGGEVYGNSNKDFLEENDPTNPITPYGYGKLCIEHALRSIWSHTKQKYTILRISNPVGKHQIDYKSVRGLIANVLIKLNKKEKIIVHGNGNAIRDFFCVEDLCDLVDRILKSQINTSEIINVSSGVGHSINEVIKCIFDLYGKKVPVHYENKLCPRILRNVLSNDYACNTYAWEPEINLKIIINQIRKEIFE